MKKSIALAFAIAHLLSTPIVAASYGFAPEKTIDDVTKISEFVKEISSTIDDIESILEDKAPKRDEIASFLSHNPFLVEKRSGTGVSSFTLNDSYAGRFIGMSAFNIKAELRGSEPLIGASKATIEERLGIFQKALADTKDYYELFHPSTPPQKLILSDISVHHLPAVNDKELQKYLKELFQEKDRCPGGTAGILYVESVRPVWAEKTHLKKGKDAYARLQRFEQDEKLRHTEDFKIVIKIMKDLLSGIQLFEPDFTGEADSASKSSSKAMPKSEGKAKRMPISEPVRKRAIRSKRILPAKKRESPLVVQKHVSSPKRRKHL